MDKNDFLEGKPFTYGNQSILFRFNPELKLISNADSNKYECSIKLEENEPRRFWILVSILGKIKEIEILFNDLKEL